MNRAWQSLSGNALEGETVTRFVYLDESGISNPKHEPFLIVAGVIVDADRQLKALERSIERIADRKIPAQHRDGFFFHAKDLFAGEGPVFGKTAALFTLEERLKIADELAALPRKLGLPVTFGIIERAKWPATFDGSSMTPKEKVAGEHLSAFMTCAIDVEVWMRKNAPNEVTMLIVEDNKEMKVRMKETQNAFRRKDIVDKLGDGQRQYFPFKKIKTSPLFEAKEDSVALQLADFCAYVIKRRAMQDEHSIRFFSVLEPLIHRLSDAPTKRSA